MAKKTIDDVNLKNKKILMRCDFNVPLDEKGNITDDRRIKASLPSIQKVLQKEGCLILCSHLGRPKGEKIPGMSLKPVAGRLETLLNINIKMTDDAIGESATSLRSSLKPGEVLLLENLRFHTGETKNDQTFAEQLAEGCDVYINDAFGTAHRAHASTEGITHFIPECVAGYLIEKEIKFLDQAINNPKKPLLAILGGAKISGKIDVIKNLFNKVDSIIIGGGMVFTFLKAQGLEIGESLLEEDRIKMAQELLKEASQKNISMLLPKDIVVADKFDNNASKKTVSITHIPSDWMGLDIGPETINEFSEKITHAGTVVWNGPMGAFEMESFSNGTYKIAQALGKATESGSITIVGGGDSAAAVSKFGLDDQISHISTGGGASLEFLEGKNLPGIEALTDK
jgi:phosphoglycerate kinase